MPAEPANPRVELLDLLQPANGPHRFKLGDRVRAITIGIDAETKQPTVLAHREAEDPQDRYVTIVEPLKDQSRYLAELMPIEVPPIDAAVIHATE